MYGSDKIIVQQKEFHAYNASAKIEINKLAIYESNYSQERESL